jgi:tetratricopeptide (TPR) repeat protein
MNDSTPDDLVELMREANRLRFERPHDAHRLYAKAVERCREAGMKRELIRALKGQGQIERDANNGAAALALYEEALTLCRQQGDAQMLAHTVRHVGDIHQEGGRDDLAEPCYNEALSIYRRDSQTLPLDLANTIRPFALLKENAGEVEEAKRLWAEARDLYAVAKVAPGVAESSRRLARLESHST